MPIYDNDGTTNYPIGKVMENDGTTNHLIGKVYDNDGAANSLIYNAQSPEQNYVLINGLGQQENITGGWRINLEGQYWYYGGYNADKNAIRLTQSSRAGHINGRITSGSKVYISGWSKLVLRCTLYSGYGDAYKGRGYGYICLSASPDLPMTGNAVYSADVVKAGTLWVDTTNGGQHYIVCDISGVDGYYHIHAGQRLYSEDEGKTFDCQIHDIYFE